jgi:hypothetical protein
MGFTPKRSLHSICSLLVLLVSCDDESPKIVKHSVTFYLVLSFLIPRTIK